MNTVTIFGCTLLFSYMCSALSAVNAPELEAGIAVVDITPPAGYRVSGYFHERVSTGTHDPLRAKAIVFKQGETAAALVFCDLIGIDPDVATAARTRAAAETGIPASNILIAGTHTHTGPLYFGIRRTHLHQMALEREGKDPCETLDYPAVLMDKLVEAIQEAASTLQPVSLHTADIVQEGLSFNRRFHMKSGGPVRFNPGKLNPDILRPAGPIDPQVGFLLARKAGDHAPVFSLTVFAMHLDTVGGTEWSADYPGYLEKTLQEALGRDLVSVFGTGTCGDINHIDVSNDLPQKGHQEAQRIGTTLGRTIVESLTSLRAIDTPALAVHSAIVEVPLRDYTEQQLVEARKIMVKAETESVPFLEQVEAGRIVHLAARNTDRLPLEVQAFRITRDIALVGLPGEIFVELGLAIKQASPFSKTLVVELANEYPAYIPTRKAMEEGSYETVNCIVKPGGGELLVDAAVRMLEELAIREG